MTALYGHNFEHAVNDYIHQRRQIWASKVHAHAKVIALAIVEHMRPGRLTAEPSKQRLMHMCNMPRSTFERYYLIAKTLFNTVNRSGKTCLFEAKALNVAAEILALWPTAPSLDMEGEQKSPTPNMGRGQDANPPPIRGGVLPPNMEGVQIDPPSKKSEPPPNMGDRREEENLRQNARAREDDFVEVNCSAINVQVKGRRMSIDYATIAQWAVLNMCPEDKARDVVEAVARGWVIEGRIADAPAAFLRRQIAKWRLYKESDEAEIKRKSIVPTMGAYKTSQQDRDKAAHSAWLKREAEKAGIL